MGLGINSFIFPLPYWSIDSLAYRSMLVRDISECFIRQTQIRRKKNNNDDFD